MSRPRIAYLTTCSPEHPTSGHALRVHANWRVMQRIGETRVWAFDTRPPPALRRAQRQKGVVSLAARADPHAAVVVSHLTAYLRGRSMLYAKAMSPRRTARLAHELRAWGTDLLVIGETWLADLLDPLRHAAHRVAIDTHNVELLLYRQMLAEQKDLPSKLKYHLFLRNVHKLERRLVDADAIFAVSDADATIYRREQHLTRVHVLPNGLDTELYRKTDAAVEAGSLVFTGSYGYWPNEVAALHLIAMSHKLDARGIEHRVILVGRDPTAAMLAAASSAPRVTITGAVPDIQPHIERAALVVAPLTSGSGTKYKILEAMALARPVATTLVGAEGLDLVDGRHAAVAPDIDTLLERVVSLLSEPEQARTMGIVGRDHVVARHSLPALERKLRAAMAEMELS